MRHRTNPPLNGRKRSKLAMAEQKTQNFDLASPIWLTRNRFDHRYPPPCARTFISVYWKGNDMDYSLILASQMVKTNAWADNEDAFYDSLSLEGFAKLRGAVRKLKKSLFYVVRVARRASLKRMQYN